MAVEQGVVLGAILDREKVSPYIHDLKIKEILETNEYSIIPELTLLYTAFVNYGGNRLHIQVILESSDSVYQDINLYGKMFFSGFDKFRFSYRKQMERDGLPILLDIVRKVSNALTEFRRSRIESNTGQNIY